MLLSYPNVKSIESNTIEEYQNYCLYLLLKIFIIYIYYFLQKSNLWLSQRLLILAYILEINSNI